MSTVVGGRYRAIRFIARGGMGAVYEVEHIHTSERLALKLLLSTAPLEGEPLVRFKRESAAAARIKSEHVVRVTDAGIDDALGGIPFLVMDLLEGADLEAVAGAVPQAPEVVAEWLRQVAEGLSRAHALGLVHRDLKPQNLFLTARADGSPLVKILDFGIVKHGELDVSPTASGAVLGTPMYMAPEQAGFVQSDVTFRADLYALGLIAFRLLAGTSYRRGETVARLMGELASETVTPPSERGLALGKKFDVWFSKACAREPADRFTSAQEEVAALADALRGVETAELAPTRPDHPTKTPDKSPALDSFVSAPTAMMTTPPTTAPPPKRRRVTALVVGIAVAVVLVGFVLVRPQLTAPASPDAGTETSLAAPVASSRPMQLTDYPPPKTDNSEALAEYYNSWHDAYDAIRQPQLALIRATALDPMFAAAHLRLSFYVTRPASALAYQRALRYRDRLDPRDLAILRAYEPCELPERPDYDECERRVQALQRERPMDIEVLRLLGELQRRRSPGGGVASFEQLVRLDPKMASPRFSLAQAAMDRGATSEALEHLEKCLDVSASAGRCIIKQGELRASDGHCEEYARAVRRLMVFDAQNLYAPLYQLNAAMSTDAARPVVDAAVSKMPKEKVSVYRGEVALWFGEMREAFDVFGRAEAASQAEDDSVLWTTSEHLTAAEEMGDEKLLSDFLRAYLVARASRGDQGSEELFLGAIRQHHIVGESELRALRSRWAEDRRADQSITEWERWLAFDADFAQTPEEARAALGSHVGSTIPKTISIEEKAEVGRVLLLAQRPRDALPYLEAAATYCLPFESYVFSSRTRSIMRSAFLAGQAHESLGERDAACRAYAPLLKRWGAAAPRPITAENARTRAAALGCR